MMAASRRSASGRSPGKPGAGVKVYPIFLPHAGCPFQCVYCNQHAVASAPPVSGASASGRRGDERQDDGAGGERAVLSSFEEQLAGLLKHCTHPGEIAFYGGTFTAIASPVLRRILDTVTPWVERGVFDGIRFSTRPDRITPRVRALLAGYPVRTVELGVQSLSDAVLAASRRGYSPEAVFNAASLVRKNGWRLGIQLMAGLPGDTRERFLESVSRTAAMKPDLVRIYPTLVLRDTPLAGLFLAGGYRPLGLDEALDWCASAYDAFLRADIPIARMGLHADRGLEKPGAVLAGPRHPAFGYLARVRWWRNRVDECLRDSGRRDAAGERLTLRVPACSISEVVGPGRCNVSYWRDKWKMTGVEVVADREMAPHRFDCGVSARERMGGM